MKIPDSRTIFFIAFTWLLLTLYPPWAFVNSDHGVWTAYYGMALGPLWQEPDMPPLKIAFGLGSGVMIITAINYPVLATEYIVALIVWFCVVRFRGIEAAGNSGKLFAALSVICVGAICVLLAPHIKEDTTPVNMPNLDQVTVVYTNKAILKGAVISPRTLEVFEINRSQSPQAAISKAAAAIGHVAKRNIARDAIILEEDLEP